MEGFSATNSSATAQANALLKNGPHTQSSKKSPQKSLRSKFVEMMLQKVWIFEAYDE